MIENALNPNAKNNINNININNISDDNTVAMSDNMINKMEKYMDDTMSENEENVNEEIMNEEIMNEEILNEENKNIVGVERINKEIKKTIGSSRNTKIKISRRTRPVGIYKEIGEMLTITECCQNYVRQNAYAHRIRYGLEIPGIITCINCYFGFNQHKFCNPCDILNSIEKDNILDLQVPQINDNLPLDNQVPQVPQIHRVPDPIIPLTQNEKDCLRYYVKYHINAHNLEGCNIMAFFRECLLCEVKMNPGYDQIMQKIRANDDLDQIKHPRILEPEPLEKFDELESMENFDELESMEKFDELEQMDPIDEESHKELDNVDELSDDSIEQMHVPVQIEKKISVSRSKERINEIINDDDEMQSTQRDRIQKIIGVKQLVAEKEDLELKIQDAKAQLASNQRLINLQHTIIQQLMTQQRVAKCPDKKGDTLEKINNDVYCVKKTDTSDFILVL